jgi:hypothetical protein
MEAAPYVPSIAAETLTLGDRIGTGANGAVFAAELRGAHGVLQVCAKVGRPRVCGELRGLGVCFSVKSIACAWKARWCSWSIFLRSGERVPSVATWCVAWLSPLLWLRLDSG